MRISDWSSDVCSSDLVKAERQSNNRKVYRDYWWQFAEKRPALYHAIGWGHQFEKHPTGWDSTEPKQEAVLVCSEVTKHLGFVEMPNRSEERRVGKECVSTCRTRWSP